MWTAGFIAFLALMIVIAAPLHTFCAVLCAFVGYQIGHTQIGQGAGIAAGVVGFLGGFLIGHVLHRKLIPNWTPGLDGAFALAIAV
jgi:hypothetical protein